MRRPSLRRGKTPEPAASTVVKPGGKGRPTPTRAEAQAAARARAKAPTGRKETARLQREQRAQTNARAREGMRTGDDRFLPARDRGPVRRFVRDFIDSRLCMAELLLPLLLLVVVSGAISRSLSSGLWSATILLVLLDTLLLVFRLRTQLRTRFPDTSTKGAVGYGVLRSLQLRFARIPKRQVRLGQKLPERY